MVALISILFGMLWAEIMLGLSRRNRGQGIFWVLAIGICLWFAWMIVAGVVWHFQGLAWAFLATPITLGLVLLSELF